MTYLQQIESYRQIHTRIPYVYCTEDKYAPIDRKGSFHEAVRAVSERLHPAGEPERKPCTLVTYVRALKEELDRRIMPHQIEMLDGIPVFALAKSGTMDDWTRVLFVQVPNRDVKNIASIEALLGKRRNLSRV